MLKSETFTPIFYTDLAKQPVTFVADVHGRDGPVSVSYPNYYWPQSGECSPSVLLPSSFDIKTTGSAH